MSDNKGVEVTGLGLAKLRPEGSYQNYEGGETTKEEYDTEQSKLPKSRWIELNYKEGQINDLDTEQVLCDIAQTIEGFELGNRDGFIDDCLAYIANELIPEDNEL